jgi:hypothetical protein
MHEKKQKRAVDPPGSVQERPHSVEHADHLIQLLPLLKKHPALQIERSGKVSARTVKMLPDLAQRKVQKFKRQNLLKPDQIFLLIIAMSLRVATARLQETLSIVEAQRPFRRSRYLGESADRIGFSVTCDLDVRLIRMLFGQIHHSFPFQLNA